MQGKVENIPERGKSMHKDTEPWGRREDAAFAGT